ncbi:MAG: HGGxSTG domain-containing protein [Desulforhopalus sp.]
MKCSEKTLKGEQCKFDALPGNDYCLIHLKKRSYTFDRVQNDLAREEIKVYAKRKKEWEKSHPGQRYWEPFPKNYATMVCGAKTRAGSPCKRKDIYSNGRCALHGGLSTGPRTAEGKKRSSQNWQGSEVTGKVAGCNAGI